MHRTSAPYQMNACTEYVYWKRIFYESFFCCSVDRWKTSLLSWSVLFDFALMCANVCVFVGFFSLGAVVSEYITISGCRVVHYIFNFNRTFLCGVWFWIDIRRIQGLSSYLIFKRIMSWWLHKVIFWMKIITNFL